MRRSRTRHHQAAILLQGHHGWDSGFHRINARLPNGLVAKEVVAESWPNETLIEACIDCVDSWRQSPGHWAPSGLGIRCSPTTFIAGGMAYGTPRASSEGLPTAPSHRGIGFSLLRANCCEPAPGPCRTAVPIDRNGNSEQGPFLRVQILRVRASRPRGVTVRLGVTIVTRVPAAPLAECRDNSPCGKKCMVRLHGAGLLSRPPVRQFWCWNDNGRHASRHDVQTPPNVRISVRLVNAAPALVGGGCATCQLPRIDPSGDRLFLPANAPPPVPVPVQAANARAPSPTGQWGISVSPSQVIAPVGSEVIMIASVCGIEGYMLTNQRVEWMISPEGVGQFMSPGEREPLEIGHWLHGLPRKVDNKYVINTTLFGGATLDRGTPTLSDDVFVQPGQSWVTVTSPTEGTSRVTVFAPEVYGWDRRQQTASIYWVDAQWRFPAPSIAPAGSRNTLTTTVTRQTDGSPLPGWRVRYEVAGGPEASFAPDGTPSVEIVTNDSGEVAGRDFPTAADGRHQSNIDPSAAPQHRRRSHAIDAGRRRFGAANLDRGQHRARRDHRAANQPARVGRPADHDAPTGQQSATRSHRAWSHLGGRRHRRAIRDPSGEPWHVDRDGTGGQRSIRRRFAT